MTKTRPLPRAIALAILLAATISTSAAPRITEARSRADIATHFDRGATLRVLNVWATWCAPCVAEMPALQKIHESFAHRGVSFVALSMDDALPGSRDSARRRVESFVESRALSFTNLLYVGSLPNIETELGLGGEIPVTILFDRNGNELKRIEGIIDADEFRAELETLLSRKTSTAR